MEQFDSLIKLFENDNTFSSISSEDLNEIIQNIESLFMDACCEGHINLATILYNLSVAHKITLSDYCYNTSFQRSCQYGHIDIAKWLLKTHEQINIRDQHDFAFIASCYYQHKDVIDWLCTLTDRYSITFTEYNTIIPHIKID